MGWAPNYTTPDALADYVRIGDAADDVQLALAIAAASRAIDRLCGRQFGKLSAAAPRYYGARWDVRRGLWRVPIDDLMTATGLVVDYDAAADESYSSPITAYTLGPRNAAADGRPWVDLTVKATSAAQPAGLVGEVRITALWGWTAIPEAIEQACLLQASRLFARRNSPYGIAGSADQGSELRLLAKVDPDVQVALRPYRRVWGAV